MRQRGIPEPQNSLGLGVSNASVATVRGQPIDVAQDGAGGQEREQGEDRFHSRRIKEEEGVDQLQSPGTGTRPWRNHISPIQELSLNRWQTVKGTRMRTKMRVAWRVTQPEKQEEMRGELKRQEVEPIRTRASCDRAEKSRQFGDARSGLEEFGQRVRRDAGNERAR
jgi:hypothetical protein